MRRKHKGRVAGGDKDWEGSLATYGHGQEAGSAWGRDKIDLMCYQSNQNEDPGKGTRPLEHLPPSPPSFPPQLPSRFSPPPPPGGAGQQGTGAGVSSPPRVSAAPSSSLLPCSTVGSPRVLPEALPPSPMGSAWARGGSGLEPGELPAAASGSRPGRPSPANKQKNPTHHTNP